MILMTQMHTCMLAAKNTATKPSTKTRSPVAVMELTVLRAIPSASGTPTAAPAAVERKQIKKHRRTPGKVSENCLIRLALFLFWKFATVKSYMNIVEYTLQEMTTARIPFIRKPVLNKPFSTSPRARRKNITTKLGAYLRIEKTGVKITDENFHL